MPFLQRLLRPQQPANANLAEPTPGVRSLGELEANSPKERPYASTTCPSCGVELAPLPKAKKSCRSCREPIYVRSGPDDKRHLLRETDLAAFEAEWTRVMAEREYIRRAHVYVDNAGFASIAAELAAKGPGYTVRDVYWTAANRYAIDAIRRHDFSDLSAVYFDMARAAHEESGKDRPTDEALRLTREAQLASLRNYAQSGARQVDVSTCSCEPCSNASQQPRPLPDELASPRLPHPGCEYGLCGCCYLPVV